MLPLGGPESSSQALPSLFAALWPLALVADSPERGPMWGEAMTETVAEAGGLTFSLARSSV